MSRGAQHNIPDERGKKPLQLALEQRNGEIAKLMLNQCTSDLTDADLELVMRTVAGDQQFLALLPDKYKVSVLKLAVERGCVDIARALLDRNSRIEGQDERKSLANAYLRSCKVRVPPVEDKDRKVRRKVRLAPDWQGCRSHHGEVGSIISFSQGYAEVKWEQPGQEQANQGDAINVRVVQGKPSEGPGVKKYRVGAKGRFDLVWHEEGLIEAARDGNWEYIEFELAEPDLVNEVQAKEALEGAAQSGQVRVVKAFISWINLYKNEERVRRAFPVAEFKNLKEQVIRKWMGRLNSALQDQEDLVAKAFLEHLEIVRKWNPDSLLHLAAREGYGKVIEHMLLDEEGKRYVWTEDTEQRVALHVAAKHAKGKIGIETMRKLIAVMRDTPPPPGTGRASFARRSSSGLLLSPLDVKDTWKKSALMYAAGLNVTSDGDVRIPINNDQRATSEFDKADQGSSGSEEHGFKGHFDEEMVLALVENEADIIPLAQERILFWLAEQKGAISPDMMLKALMHRKIRFSPNAIAAVIRNSPPGIATFLDSWLEDYSRPDFCSFAKLGHKVKAFSSAKEACDFSKGEKGWSSIWNILPRFLRWRPNQSRVSVRLQRVPEFIAPLENLNNPAVIRALADLDDLAVLDSTLAKAIVAERWHEVKVQNDIDIVYNIVAIVCACILAAEIRNHGAASTTALIMVLAVMVAKTAVEELFQIIARCRERKFLRYFNIHSSVDWAYILTSALGVLSLWRPDATNYTRLILAFWFGILWLHLLYSFRTVASVGPRFLPIFFAIRETMPFFLVVAFCISGAVHAYYMVGPRSDPSPFYAAFMQVFRLGVMGDFDLYELEGQDTVFVKESETIWAPEDPSPSEFYLGSHILFYLIACGVAIVLMNLMIGILGTNYDTYEDLAEQLFLRERARMILNFNSRPWLDILGCCKPKVGGNQELFVIVREEATADEQRSMRSVFKMQVAKQSDVVSARMDARIDELGTHVAELDKKLNKICDILAAPAKYERSATWPMQQR